MQRGFCIVLIGVRGIGGLNCGIGRGGDELHRVPRGALVRPGCVFRLAHVEWGREMNIASKVGSRIRTLREAAGLTQSELAATAYVTHQSVGNWERGNTLPDVQSL